MEFKRKNNSIGRKIVVGLVALIMVFSAFSFLGCGEGRDWQQDFAALEAQVAALEEKNENIMVEQREALLEQLEAFRNHVSNDSEQGRQFDRLLIRINALNVGCGMISFCTWSQTSGRPSHIIEVNHYNENTIFELTAEKGRFIYSWELLQTVNLNYSSSIVYSRNSFLDLEQDFITVVLRVGQNIIGYAVIEVYMVIFSTISNHPHARVLVSYLFPKIDGEYQDITIEEVNLRMRKIIDSARLPL